jgi:hypothetical protein
MPRNTLPSPLETKLEGAFQEFSTGCDVSLLGHSKRGKVEIRGTITVANFRGTISRQIGKKTFLKNVVLRRKLGEPNDHKEVEDIDPIFKPLSSAKLTTQKNRPNSANPLNNCD